MNEKRYNVFNQIHKGLRGLLYDTASSIQTTDFDSDSAISTINKIKLVVDLFDEHAHHEDAHLLPMIVVHNPELVDNFEKDHLLDHKLSEDLRTLCQTWEKSAKSEEKILTGQQLFYAFNEFIAFNLYHMNREEHELLLTLWQHYSDTDLLATQQNIIQSIKPEVLMIESKWMMCNLNNSEIIQWLSNIKLGAPMEVFESYIKLAEDNLITERWSIISKALEIQPVAA